MAESRNKMQKQSLLTIGLLSKITDVSIKSLRYYERIGILQPAYTDEKPDTAIIRFHKSISLTRSDFV